MDPAIARAPSPSFTYLSLQEAQQEAALAQARARAEALEGVLNEADALRKLVGQALQVQVLAPPAEALFPVSPWPLRWGVLAGLAVAAVGALVLLLFVSSGGSRVCHRSAAQKTKAAVARGLRLHLSQRDFSCDVLGSVPGQ